MHIQYIGGFNKTAQCTMLGTQILNQTSNFTGNHTFFKKSPFPFHTKCWLPSLCKHCSPFTYFFRKKLFIKLKGMQVQNMYQDPVANAFNSILNH